MITAVNRPAALHINLAAIKENTRQAKAHLKPGQKLFCVVKANAYGHGAARLAPVMEEAGADGFCVGHAG
jgi:alanine racemase